jgi:hypothetical protein
MSVSQAIRNWAFGCSSFSYVLLGLFDAESGRLAGIPAVHFTIKPTKHVNAIGDQMGLAERRSGC